MTTRAFTFLFALLAVLPATGASAAKPVSRPLRVSLEWAATLIAPTCAKIAYVRLPLTEADNAAERLASSPRRQRPPPARGHTRASRARGVS